MLERVQRKLWNRRVSFRISEKCLGLNETKGNLCEDFCLVWFGGRGGDLFVCLFSREKFALSREKWEREQTGG